MSNFVKLGTLVDIKTGKLDANASSNNGEYPFFTCSINPLKIDSYSYDCECVLVAGNGDLNVKYYNGKFDAYQRTYIIESKNNIILNVKYLYYFLDMYVDKLREQSIGGVIKYIKLGHLTEAIIPLPIIEKQTYIVKLLDKAKTLINKRKSQIDGLDNLIQSIFYDMFGEPIKNYKNYNKYKLSQFGNIITGNTPPRNDSTNYGNYIEWIKSDNINTPFDYLTESEEYLSKIGLKKARYVENGAILMTCIAGSISCIGNVSIANRTVSFNQQINAIQPYEDVDTYFLYNLLKFCKTYIQKSSTNSMKGMLSKGNLSDLEFIKPDIEEQKQFSYYYEIITKYKDMINVSLNELELLNKSLMQRTFNRTLFERNN